MTEAPVAVVTGGASGIGAAVVTALRDRGYAIGTIDLSGETGADHAVAADVSDGTAVAGAVAEIRAELGPIAALVTSAGYYEMAPVSQISAQAWQRMLRVHVGGLFHAARACLPDMLERQWGRVLTIISDAGRRGERNQVVYGAAKAAAAGFTRGLAVEVGRSGITVNCISLGSIRHGDMARNLDDNPEREHALIRPYPVGRLGRVDDPAPLAVLLCSDAAEWITGQVYPVDGGYAPAL